MGIDRVRPWIAHPRGDRETQLHALAQANGKRRQGCRSRFRGLGSGSGSHDRRRGGRCCRCVGRRGCGRRRHIDHQWSRRYGRVEAHRRRQTRSRCRCAAAGDNEGDRPGHDQPAWQRDGPRHSCLRAPHVLAPPCRSRCEVSPGTRRIGGAILAAARRGRSLSRRKDWPARRGRDAGPASETRRAAGLAERPAARRGS